MTRLLSLQVCPYVIVAGVTLFPFSAHAASAVITEIMYDLPGTDSGREWIEIQNTGTETISFGDWKFFEGNTNHGLSFSRGEATTSASGFAVIADDPAKFLADWPNFAGTLFGSSFSLGNSGETLALKQDGVVVDQVTYSSVTGAAGDGNSLQRVGSGWQAALPTPGAAFGGAGSVPPPSATTNTGSTTPASPQVGSSSAELSPSSKTPTSGGGGGSPPFEPQLFARATVPAKAVAGADALFEAEALGKKREPLLNARYLWSFGDGASAEGKRVLHAYHYPAIYAVLVEVSSGEWSATDRRDITVVAPELSIPRIKEGDDGFIEIQNSGSDDVDLSRWFLQNRTFFFSFPNRTIIPARRSIPFPAAITKLAADPASVSVLYPNGTIAVRYEPKETHAVMPPPAPVPAPAPEQKPEPVVEQRPVAKLSAPSKEPAKPELEDVPVPGESVASSTELVAASGAVEGGVTPWVLGVAALVIVSIGGYVFATRSRPPASPPSAAEMLRKEAAEFEVVE